MKWPRWMMLRKTQNEMQTQNPFRLSCIVKSRFVKLNCSLLMFLALFLLLQLIAKLLSFFLTAHALHALTFFIIIWSNRAARLQIVQNVDVECYLNNNLYRWDSEERKQTNNYFWMRKLCNIFQSHIWDYCKSLLCLREGEGGWYIKIDSPSPRTQTVGSSCMYFIFLFFTTQTFFFLEFDDDSQSTKKIIVLFASWDSSRGSEDRAKESREE